MTCAETIVQRIEVAGGVLALNGDHVRFRLPQDSAELLADLREHKHEIVLLLKKREEIPVVPPGMRVVRWEPKTAPVILTRFSVVTDVTKFISATLRELAAALAGKRWLAGNWSAGELVDRLEQCGVLVQIEGQNRGQ
jgi:hypothetical protein